MAFEQAVARELKDPSFRVIQNHFAILGNLGEATTKVYSLWKLILEYKCVICGLVRGLKDPSFHVIQNHFAILGNLGETTTKGIWL